MSYIEDASREALSTAVADGERAKRAFLVTAALLLLHVLTVTPYISITAELTEVVPRIAKTEETLMLLKAQTDELLNARKNAQTNSSPSSELPQPD